MHPISPARLGALLIGTLTTLIGLAPARAQEHPRIAVGPAGPAAPLPVGQTFILHGPIADDVVELQPVVVRTAWSAFGGAFAPDWIDEAGACARVARALSPAQLRAGAMKSRGAVAIEALWAAPTAQADEDAAALAQRRADYAALTRWQNAFVPAPWVAAAGPRRAFELRVEGDRFFRPGASYCLLMIERRARLVEDTETVRRALVDGARGCVALATATSTAALEQAVVSCRESTKAGVMAALDARDALDRPQRAAIERVVDASLLRAVIEMRWAELVLGRRLLALAPHLRWRPQPLMAADSPFGRFVLTALTAADHLRLLPGGGWATLDGALGVEQVALRRDAEAIVLSGAGASVKLETPASQVWLASRAITARDLVLLARGEVAFADAIDSIRRLGERVPEGPFHLGDQGPAPDPHQRANRLAAVLEGVADTLSQADARQQKQPAAGPADWVDGPLSAWAARAYPPAGREALSAAAVAAGTFVRARRVWQARVDAVAFTLREVRVAGGATITERARLDSQTWFAHYVVPTVGMAWLDRDAFAQGYVALELYGWANRYDEPMWTNGLSDWRRLFAVELGFATATKGLGPEERIDGPLGGMPPVFIGAVAHLLPYGSVSVGQALMRRRRSGLPGERGPLVGQLYVGAALQVNLLQLFGEPILAPGGVP